MIDLQAYLEQKRAASSPLGMQTTSMPFPSLSIPTSHMSMTVYQTLRSFQSVIKQSTIAVVRVNSPRNAGITPFGGRRKRL